MHTDRCGNTCRQKCCAKGRGKKLKYKSLCIEVQRMWNLKCTIIPVIIGTIGIVTRSLGKNLEAVPGIHSIDSLQKTAILGISHIIRNILQCEAWSLSIGDHRWFTGSREAPGRKGPWQETFISYDDDDDNNNNNVLLLLIIIIIIMWLENTWLHWAENCSDYPKIRITGVRITVGPL